MAKIRDISENMGEILGGLNGEELREVLDIAQGFERRPLTPIMRETVETYVAIGVESLRPTSKKLGKYRSAVITALAASVDILRGARDKHNNIPKIR